ncbi:MAG TPA: protoporphyrinogen oxidase [Chloroflexia bacterium]|nr:protoporphyrinogen oxidase [Chloroflexia bacterium]
MTRVVIIGGGITGLAAAWELQQQGIDYILLEGSERLGGKIKTDRSEGFIIEGAADSFLGAQKPWAWQLCREAGLSDRMVGTNDHNRNVYILKDGRLQMMPRGMRLLVPTDPDGLLESELLSEEGKRRMLAEPEIPARSESGDESLASFVRRRFGEEALDVFGEPLLAGIHVGNPETLSMQATYPNYLAMERTHGSLIEGTRKAVPPGPALADAPKTVFVSFRNGMYEMIEGLSAKLTGDIRLGEKVTRVEPDGTLHTSSGAVIKADKIILTVPAHTAQKLLVEAAPKLAEELKQIHTVSSATVSFGFREADLPHPLDGFGFVVASSEPTHLLASTWSSTKLAGRAPEGYALIRVFLGGHRHEQDAKMADEELIALARSELAKVMGIEAEPVITRIFRWIDANTQYEVGHMERVANFQQLCPDWLKLTGAAYGGVGIPDCVRQGRETARQVAASLEKVEKS